MDQVSLLTPREAASFLSSIGISRTPATLAKLRVVGGGPKFRRFGRSIRYARNDLNDWVNANLTNALCSTSDVSREVRP